MRGVLQRIRSGLWHLAVDKEGSAIVETMIMAPVILILLGGVLEFGALLHNRQLIEDGLRDAARYLARCQDATYGCNESTARQIAIYGSPDGTVPKVGGWGVGDVTVTYTEFAGTGAGGEFLFHDGDPVDVVRVGTQFNYPGGSLLGLLGLPFITISAFHEERFIGW